MLYSFFSWGRDNNPHARSWFPPPVPQTHTHKNTPANLLLHEAYWIFLRALVTYWNKEKYKNLIIKHYHITKPHHLTWWGAELRQIAIPLNPFNLEEDGCRSCITSRRNKNKTEERQQHFSVETITGRKNKEKGFRSFTTESGGGTTSGQHCSADENFSKEKGGRQFMWKVGVFCVRKSFCEKMRLR